MRRSKWGSKKRQVGRGVNRGGNRGVKQEQKKSMGTRGIIVLIAQQVVLKMMVSHDMYLGGTINEIVELIVRLIQTKQVTDPNALVTHIFKAAQKHGADIPPLDHRLNVEISGHFGSTHTSSISIPSAFSTWNWLAVFTNQ